jgi:hypothetical protein
MAREFHSLVRAGHADMYQHRHPGVDDGDRPLHGQAALGHRQVARFARV